MSNNKIFYIGNFELPDKNAAAHRVVNNAKALRNLGYEVVLIGVNKDMNLKGKTDNFHNFKCYSLPYPNGIKQWLKSIINAKQYLQIIEKEGDCNSIILYNMPSMVIYNLMSYAKKMKIKIYFDCTEWNQNSLRGNIFVSLFKIFDSNLRMYYLNKKFDGIISISTFLNDYYNKENKIYSIKIPPLVDLTDDKWKVSKTYSKEGLQIVYAGGAFSIKDNYVKDRLDLVVLAFAELKKKGNVFNFKVIGCSKNDFLQFYPQYTNQIEYLDSYITFLDKIPHLEAIDIVKKSSYSIFLRDENIVTKAGFPTKFVESISAGTPVLTNKNSNVGDYIQHGKNGYLLNVENSVTIVNSLIPAFSNTDLELSEMKEFTYSSNLFDYNNYIDKFKLFFNEYE
jgi:glycosyltransferase involved in cell wall biosynthesis